MDVYVYDSEFRQVDIIDDFISLIWTERYGQAGEATVTAADNLANRTALKEDNFLQIGESNEAVQIDTFNAKDGVITVKGQMLSGFLAQRMVKRSWNNTNNYVQLSGNPFTIIQQLITNYASSDSGYMGSGAVTTDADGPYELFPNLSIATPIVDDTDILDLIVTMQVPQGTLYDAIKYVTDLFSLGFTLFPANISDDGYDLVFGVYQGKNRTRFQDNNPVVSFQSSLDRLTDVEELRSKANYKTVAWAYATGIQAADPYVGVAYASPAARFDTGFKRRTLFVQVDDVQTEDVNLTTPAGRAAFVTLLNNKAANALVQNNYVRMADGTIIPQDDFIFGVHYYLGDILELVSDDGVVSAARVTEYIYSEDENGFTAYPTLSAIS